MIIKNTGSVKDIKINGILTKIVPGINILKDNKTLVNIVRLNKDLSILKELPKKEIKITVIKVEPIVEKPIVENPIILNTFYKHKKKRKNNGFNIS